MPQRSNDEKPTSSRASDEGTKKRRYEKPAVLGREPLEAVAALCSPPGKADPGACPIGPINS